MDPLSSLTVASSAIQIFDFSSKLWKQICELSQSENGATIAQEGTFVRRKKTSQLELESQQAPNTRQPTQGSHDNGRECSVLV